MNLKWVFWTGLLAILVFFGVIYFGIKYDWVNESRPSTSSNSKQVKKSLDTNAEKLSSVSSSDSTIPKAKRNSVNPELIDETAIPAEEKVLGSADLTIEEVVSGCQSLSEAIGIPQDKLDQAISECVDRNSGHLASEGEQSTNERDKMIREQCNVAITQQDLLSEGEVKMLVDECVASMSIN